MLTPTVGKKYIARRQGKTRRVIVLKVIPGNVVWGSNTHWGCEDLKTKRKVVMKSSWNFLEEIVD